MSLNGCQGIIGVLLLAGGLAAVAISLVTSYWEVKDDHHRGYWVDCKPKLLVVGSIECVSNIEGNADNERYRDNQWYVMIVCCHIGGLLLGLLAVLVTLWGICAKAISSSRTFLVLIFAIASSVGPMASLIVWKVKFTDGDDDYKDGWSFYMAIGGVVLTGLGAIVLLVAAISKK